jgi:hypothetical protein
MVLQVFLPLVQMLFSEPHVFHPSPISVVDSSSLDTNCQYSLNLVWTAWHWGSHPYWQFLALENENKCPVYSAEDQRFKLLPVTWHLLGWRLSGRLVFSASHCALAVVNIWCRKFNLLIWAVPSWWPTSGVGVTLVEFIHALIMDFLVLVM